MSPGLKKCPRFVGNYGTAWQNPEFEFAVFPGPIIVTMNEVGLEDAKPIGPDRAFPNSLNKPNP
jgi:hydroxylamine reductase (hybrid-cluster protein)